MPRGIPKKPRGRKRKAVRLELDRNEARYLLELVNGKRQGASIREQLLEQAFV